MDFIKNKTNKGIIILMNKIAGYKEKIAEAISNEKGAESYTNTVLLIVIGVIAAGIILALCLWFFNDQFRSWFENTTKSYFPTGGETRPTR